MLAYSASGAWTKWEGQQMPLNGAGLFSLPQNVETLCSKAELAVYGLYPIGDATALPDGYRVVSTSIGDDGGSPRWVNETEEIPLAELKADKLSKVAVRRWQAEMSGIIVNGTAIQTDRSSRTEIYDKAHLAGTSATYSAVWKTSTGEFVTLTAAEIIVVAQAVRDHVQACFDCEAEIAAEINGAADAATLVAIDISAGWPD